MRLLVTGSRGQVGTELTWQSQALGWTVKAVDQDELDVTDAKAVDVVMADFMPGVVINAAAYTAVDKAEKEAAAAFRVNRDGPENLAVACAGLDIPLIHYSTDYVFDGNSDDAYLESDPVSPPGIYGESKLAGEQAVLERCSKYFVIRTSWVFSAHGHNFVKTMLKLAAERETLDVVSDQFGKPTSAAEIARLTLDVLAGAGEAWGIYHLAQPDAITWHGFAEVIFEEARRQGMSLKVKDVRAIRTADYPTLSRRPANSALDCDKLESVFDIHIRPWRESLKEVIRELWQQGGEMRGRAQTDE